MTNEVKRNPARSEIDNSEDFVPSYIKNNIVPKIVNFGNQKDTQSSSIGHEVQEFNEMKASGQIIDNNDFVDVPGFEQPIRQKSKNNNIFIEEIPSVKEVDNDHAIIINGEFFFKGCKEEVEKELEKLLILGHPRFNGKKVNVKYLEVFKRLKIKSGVFVE